MISFLWNVTLIQCSWMKGTTIVSDEILTIDEAAQMLKVTPEIVKGLLEDGELPGRPVGGHWRTTTRALVGFVDSVPTQAACCCMPADASATGELSAVGVGCCDPRTGCC